MSTEQNKAFVHRFITEALSGRNVDRADEIVAPNYVIRRRPGDAQVQSKRLYQPFTAGHIRLLEQAR